MLINTFGFAIVFLVIFILYWLVPTQLIRIRNIFLLLVSYLLYLNWKPSFALVLFGVTVYRANLRVSFLCNLTVPTYLSSLLYFH